MKGVLQKLYTVTQFGSMHLPFNIHRIIHSFGSAAFTFSVLLAAGIEAQQHQLINNFSNLVIEWTRTQISPPLPC